VFLASSTQRVAEVPSHSLLNMSPVVPGDFWATVYKLMRSQCFKSGCCLRWMAVRWTVEGLYTWVL